MPSWEYQRKTERPQRADKGKKKPARSNTYTVVKLPAGVSRAEFLDTIRFVRAL